MSRQQFDIVMTGKPPFIASLLSTPTSASLSEARNNLCIDANLPNVKLSDQELSQHLTNAVSQGDSDLVHRILQMGCHINVDCASRTPLICSAASKGYTDIVGLLLRHGANVNQRTPEDSSALICAADNGQLATLSLLLNAGAAMNVTNRQGETALARATRRGWTQCARQLLLHGTNPHPMPTDGHSLVVSPLHLARQLYQSQIEQEILTRVVAMDEAMSRIVQATLPAQTSLIEPGHLKDTKTMSLFPIQLISDDEMHHFVLYFKTPPGYAVTGESKLGPSDKETSVTGSESSGSGPKRSGKDASGRRSISPVPSDEVILVYVVRVQLHEGVVSLWPSGPGFPGLGVSFNGTRRNSGRLPIPTDYKGLSVTSVPLAIRSGGLNTLCLEMSSNLSIGKEQVAFPKSIPYIINGGNNLALVGAYRVRLDVIALIQTSMMVSPACASEA